MMQDNEAFPGLLPCVTGWSHLGLDLHWGVGCRPDPHSSRCAALVSSLRKLLGPAWSEPQSAPGLIFAKAGLKLNIQKTKIMVSSRITSWQIDGETVETVADFNFGGSKITTDGDCSHEIKRRLLLGRKVMTNLDSILKSRDITLSTKVHLVKAIVFPVVVYGC